MHPDERLDSLNDLEDRPVADDAAEFELVRESAGGERVLGELGAGESSDGKLDAKQERKKSRSGFLEVLVLVMTALILALTLKTYVAEAYEIKGSSMLPTFHNGERVVVLKTFYDIERGDVVIFSSTEDPTKDLIKRVIGLPGDEILIKNGKVYVSGEPLDEEYIRKEDLDRSGMFGFIREKVKPNEYYVLGDNRGDSHDSRRFHGVPKENFKGKVVVRWWPIEGLRSF